MDLSGTDVSGLEGASIVLEHVNYESGGSSRIIFSGTVAEARLTGESTLVIETQNPDAYAEFSLESDTWDGYRPVHVGRQIILESVAMRLTIVPRLQ